MSTSYTLTLPADDGCCGETLTTNGSGTLTWAAAAGGPSQANQAAVEAETNEDTYVPPDLLRHHPGVAKAHGYTDGDSSGGGTLTGAYNISAVTNDSNGRYTWTWNTDFSNDDYTMIAVINETTAAGTADADRAGNTAGAGKTSTFVQMHVTDGDTLGSLPHYVVAYGDQ